MAADALKKLAKGLVDALKAMANAALSVLKGLYNFFRHTVMGAIMAGLAILRGDFAGALKILVESAM